MITPLLMSGDTRTRAFFAKSPTKIMIDGRWHKVWREYVVVEERYVDVGSCRWWEHVSGRVVSPPPPTQKKLFESSLTLSQRVLILLAGFLGGGISAGFVLWITS